MLEKKTHALVPTHENKTNTQQTGQQRPEAAAPAALRRNVRVLGTMSPFYSAGHPKSWGEIYADTYTDANARTGLQPAAAASHTTFFK